LINPLEVATFGISAGAVFGLLALGLVLIYRTTGVMNFGHWAIGLVAVVTYALLTGQGMNVWPALVICVALAVFAGVAAYRVVFRRIARSNQILVILVAVGVAQFYSSLASLVLGFRPFTRLPAWLPMGTFQVSGLRLRANDMYTITVGLAVAIGFFFWFRRSRSGQALRAVAQNREAAVLAGIDDVKYSSLAWAIGSGLAALALLIIMPHSAGRQGGLITTFDLTPLGTLLVPAFGAALVGGLVNLPMALAGGVFFGLIREFLVLAPRPWSELRTSVAAFVIVILLLLRTERFFATRQELEALEA
jgi:branched-chain amino acid transport system permease protein